MISLVNHHHYHHEIIVCLKVYVGTNTWRAECCGRQTNGVHNAAQRCHESPSIGTLPEARHNAWCIVNALINIRNDCHSLSFFRYEILSSNKMNSDKWKWLNESYIQLRYIVRGRQQNSFGKKCFTNFYDNNVK